MRSSPFDYYLYRAVMRLRKLRLCFNWSYVGASLASGALQRFRQRWKGLYEYDEATVNPRKTTGATGNSCQHISNVEKLPLLISDTSNSMLPRINCVFGTELWPARQ